MLDASSFHDHFAWLFLRGAPMLSDQVNVYILAYCDLSVLWG